MTRISEIDEKSRRRSTMIADDPSQWTEYTAASRGISEQTMAILFRNYIKKRIEEGRDLRKMRQEMIDRSSYPELLIRLFDTMIAND